MPKKTIAHAFFTYTDNHGAFIMAHRGETVDVPEGADLERGEKFGAFTAHVDQEPPPPADTEIPNIDLGWGSSDYDRYVDAGHIDEIKAKFAEVPEEAKAGVARQLFDAELKGRARKQLLEFLEPVAAEKPAEIATPVSESVAALLEQNAPEVIEAAAARPELIPALIAAETGGKNRKSVLDGLGKIDV